MSSVRFEYEPGYRSRSFDPGAPYGVTPARPRSYLNFEKKKAAAALRHYRGLIWLGSARRAGGAPEDHPPGGAGARTLLAKS